MSRLFEAYQAVFDKLPDTRRAIFVPLGAGSRVRWIRLPRLHLFCRYFVVMHVRARLATLSRDCHYRAAKDPLDADARTELEQIEHFCTAVGTAPIKRLASAWIALSAAIAFVAASAFFADTKANSAITQISGSLSGLLAGELKNPVGGDLGGAVLAFALVLTAVAAIGFIPLSAFQLKRLLFNTCRDPGQWRDSADRFTWRSKGELQTTAREQAALSTGLYEYERRVFAQYGAKEPREWPWDLSGLGAVAIVVAALWIVVGLTAGHAIEGLHLDGIWTASPWVGLALLSALAPSLGVHLYRVWQRRRGIRQTVRVPLEQRATATVELVSPRDGEKLVRGAMFYATPAGWLRRAVASLVDAFFVLIAAVIAGTALIEIVGIENDVLIAVVLFLAVLPVVGGLYGVACGGRAKPARQTLGRRWLNVRVATVRGDSPGRVRIFVREAVKWLFCVGAAVFTFGVPTVVNLVMGLVSDLDQTMTDRIARTRVVHNR